MCTGWVGRLDDDRVVGHDEDMLRGLAGTIALAVVCSIAAPAAADTFKVSRTDDPAPGKCKPGNCSLREAVIATNKNGGKDTIILRSGETYELAITGIDEDEANTGDLDVLGKTSFQPTKNKRATIDANAIDRVFEVTAPAKFKRLVITGGSINQVSELGFGVKATFTRVDISRSIITGNSGPAGNSSAGGVYIGGGGSLVRSTLSSNEVTSGGGGGTVVGTPDVPFRVNRTKVVDNKAGTTGGLFTSSFTTVRRSKIARNEAAQCGGIDLNGGSPLIDSRVTDNKTVSSGGGGVCMGSGSKIIRSTVADNFAGGTGGGVDVFGGKKIVDSTIDHNTSNKSAGGVNVIFSTNFKITGSTISNNIAGEDGGGLRAGSATVFVDQSTIAGNEGVMGGGIIANDQPTGSNASRVKLTYSTVAGNNSNTGGGIASVPPASYESEGTIIATNLGAAPDCAANVTSDGHNLVGDVTGCSSFSAATDVIGMNPALMPLADYGGLTLTSKPGPSSPAIDAGGNRCHKIDQRGKKRPKGGACDVGSVEAG